MCGRFYLTATPRDLAALFFLAGLPEAAPRWATDAKLAPISARVETVADKPTFAEALGRRLPISSAHLPRNDPRSAEFPRFAVGLCQPLQARANRGRLP